MADLQLTDQPIDRLTDGLADCLVDLLTIKLTS